MVRGTTPVRKARCPLQVVGEEKGTVTAWAAEIRGQGVLGPSGLTKIFEQPEDALRGERYACRLVEPEQAAGRTAADLDLTRNRAISRDGLGRHGGTTIGAVDHCAILTVLRTEPHALRPNCGSFVLLPVRWRVRPLVMPQNPSASAPEHSR